MYSVCISISRFLYSFTSQSQFFRAEFTLSDNWNWLKRNSLIHLKEMFLKLEDIIVIMHPYRHTPMQEKRKQRGTNERKHKTIKMLIVLYGTDMWRRESGGLPWEPPPTWTTIASAVWVLKCYCAILWEEVKKRGIFERFFTLHHTLL